MAGMFYSLQEVAEKLNKTEDEVKEMVTQGKLREFRPDPENPNVVFKVGDVEALMSDTSVMPTQQAPAEPEPQTTEEEIALVPETVVGSVEAGDLGDADTVIASEGINVLGETDSDYLMADDTMGETQVASGESSSLQDLQDATSGATTGSSEASLEEIEEDVNLDTFGSGSGLLDLSLQADDTSLGGILDEIYTSEEGEGEASLEAAPEMEASAEPEGMLPEAPQPAMEAPSFVQVRAEPAPDTLSNALGIMLVLPLLAIIYTAIVAVTGSRNIMPAILDKLQGVIWYVMIGAAVIAALIVGVPFMLSASASPAAKKPKAKKAKKEKPKKEKKVKEKKVKEKKPKKEKKKKEK